MKSGFRCVTERMKVKTLFLLTLNNTVSLKETEWKFKISACEYIPRASLHVLQSVGLSK